MSNNVVIKPFLVTITRNGETEPIPYYTQGCDTVEEAKRYISAIAPEGACGNIYEIKATRIFTYLPKQS